MPLRSRILRSAPAGALLVALAGAVLAAAAWSSPVPRADASATCADHPDQAAAQRAADTRDPDGDGLYCVIYSGR